MAWQDFPMITCPHCQKESQIDDYYDLRMDDKIRCPNCEKTMYVWATDITLSGDIHSKPHT
jgi:hypothetical protein